MRRFPLVTDFLRSRGNDQLTLEIIRLMQEVLEYHKLRIVHRELKGRLNMLEYLMCSCTESGKAARCPIHNLSLTQQLRWEAEQRRAARRTSTNQPSKKEPQP